ncbi:MAG: T9SS type A sorting domain-containing protein, partial [Crocinitomicaceae bacterium]
TQASEDEILTNGFILHPQYQEGKGPINVKVVDPLNVAKGFFVLKFKGYPTLPVIPSNPYVNYPSDSALWMIYHYDAENGTLIDSVSSDKTIKSGNEQIIPEWGVSVDIGQIKYYNLSTGFATYRNLITDPIGATLAFADSSRQWLSGVPDGDQTTPLNWILSGTFISTDSSATEYNDAKTRDPESHYENLLNRTFTHISCVRTSLVGAPVCKNSKLLSAVSAIQGSPMADAVGVNLIFTSDKSLWTRSPVIEMCQDKTLSQGGGEVSMTRTAPSVDKSGLRAGQSGYNAAEGDLTSTTGMGWFPGYAIDVETGNRLNIAFGENSFLVGEHGADMVWNPTTNIMDNFGNYVFGGMHTIYILGKNVGYASGFTASPGYDKGAWFMNQVLPTASSASHKAAWQSVMWVGYPLLAYGQDLLSNVVTIKIRINKEYRDYAVNGENGSKPMYEWSTDNMGTLINRNDALADALKLINVVPNPYYAFSQYETSRLDARIKITNLPEKCNIKIFNIQGKLIQSYKKDNPLTSQDWDLKNSAGIPVAGGVYLIHVEVPGIGERIIKWFGGIRQPDLQNL